MYENYIREATEEEVKVYKMVESKLDEMTEEEVEEIIEAVTDWTSAWGSEKKNSYNKVYRIAKKLGVTTGELETWYYVE